MILIHEWNGLSQRIRETADAFAAEGYAALAADLYQGRIGQSRSENLALVRETQSDPELIIDNLNAAVLALKGRSGAEKIATVGWCFGGGVALSYALGGETSRRDRYLLRTPCHRPGFSARDYARSLRYLCWARSRPQRF